MKEKIKELSMEDKQERRPRKKAGVTRQEEHRVLAANSKSRRDCKGCMWLLDGGATDHMCNGRELFSDFSEMESLVKVGDRYILKVDGIGSCTLKMAEASGNWKIAFSTVLYIPELEDCLISVSNLEEKGMELVIRQGITKAMDPVRDELVFMAVKRDGLYHSKV